MPTALLLPLLALLGVASGFAGWAGSARHAKVFTLATLVPGGPDIPSLLPGLAFVLALGTAAVMAGARSPGRLAAAAVVALLAWPAAFWAGLFPAGAISHHLREAIPDRPPREAVALAGGFVTASLIGGTAILAAWRLSLDRPIGRPAIVWTLAVGAVAAAVWPFLVLPGPSLDPLFLFVFPCWQAVHLVLPPALAPAAALRGPEPARSS